MPDGANTTIADSLDSDPAKAWTPQEVLAIDDTSIPAPYSHGYMYGDNKYALVDIPYSVEMQNQMRSGAMKPIDYTHQNASYATAAGRAISTADEVYTGLDF